MNITKKQSSYILLIASLSLILTLLINPSLSIDAAKTGLLLWFNIVLPSLLPFIIASNILMESGSVYFFERLFTPIMQPLFRLPGSCAFPWVMGLISGYPMGAKLAANLRNENQITDSELQRLLSFCNNSGPFFILGAIGSGIFNDPKIGYFLIKIHFISSVLVGLIFRFYGQKPRPSSNTYNRVFKPVNSIGEVLASSIANSMEVIVQIGGYIIFFSVIGDLIKETKLILTLASLINHLFKPLGMTKNLALSWIIGFSEMSNGINLLAKVPSPQVLKLAIVSFILGWGGLSIHAQSLHFFKSTKIKTPLYLLGKFLHGVLAFILTYILF